MYKIEPQHVQIDVLHTGTVRSRHYIRLYPLKTAVRQPKGFKLGQYFNIFSQRTFYIPYKLIYRN